LPRNAQHAASRRSTLARLAAYERAAKHGSEVTLPAREAFQASFEAKVDPEGKLPPAERARRAKYARKAYYQRLAIQGVEGRRRKAELSRGNDATP
jgi:tyrosyl-tRNA synthetase